MIEPIEQAPDGVLAFRAVGKIEAADYETVLTPAIEAAIAEHGKIRFVYELGPEYEGYSAGAAWEDMKLWAPHLTKWERCAVVTDHRMMADTIRAFAIIMPGEMKVFPVSGLADALSWAAG
ncbi:MAG TPA: STAS/SEC14 domain-containing protein [Gaiellaceae bacterium]|nr:STAS/SEC14 domain-containing protein [Gaiellaceae bacterium]